MQILTATASSEDAGARLDLWLSQQFETLSRSRAKTLILANALKIDGHAINDPRAKVIAFGDYVLEMPEPVAATPEPEDIPLEILHEDDDLIVINKAAGMAAHPAPGTWSGTLVNALLHHCKGGLPGIGGVERPGIVHRLDKLTTGVMVAAKTEAAHAGLSGLFADHNIERTYIALTRGAPRPLVGTVDARIARSTTDRKKMAVPRDPNSQAGRHAVTHYKSIATYGLLDSRSSETLFMGGIAASNPMAQAAHLSPPRHAHAKWSVKPCMPLCLALSTRLRARKFALKHRSRRIWQNSSRLWKKCRLSFAVPISGQDG